MQRSIKTLHILKVEFRMASGFEDLVKHMLLMIRQLEELNKGEKECDMDLACTLHAEVVRPTDAITAMSHHSYTPCPYSSSSLLISNCYTLAKLAVDFSHWLILRQLHSCINSDPASGCLKV